MAQSVQGTWGIGGFKLPDFGLTELISSAIGKTSNPTYNNPAVYAQTGRPSAQNTSVYPWQNVGLSNYSGGSAVKSTQQPSGVQTQAVMAPTGGTEVAPSGFTTPEGNWYEGTQDQYNAEIDSYYNAAMGALNTAEQNLNKNLDLTKTQAESDYTANSAQLGTNKEKTMGTIATQERAGQTRKEDALAAARRLFSELSMGNQQRFGGSTSAGQAASEIQGAEMQRQMGSTNRQTNEFMQQIDTARRDVESQYQSGLLQLQQAKQQALTDAQIAFNNAITEIAQNRAQTEAQKAQMRMNALMDLRNKAFTIQQQNLTFEQQLTAMREQAKLNLENYAKTTGTNLANTTAGYSNLLANTTTNPTTQNPVGQPGQMMSSSLTGQITGTKRWDPMTGQYV